MINFETANECELKTRTIGDRTFHTLKAANTDWETDIEIGIPDNVLVDWFEERCKNLDLPIYNDLLKLPEEIEARDLTIGILEDKVRDLQYEIGDLRQRNSELKMR